MDASDDDWTVPPTTLVQPRSVGRGLPVPPVLPFVAILCILGGIMLGFRLAPTPAPSPAAARPSAVATSTPTPAPEPTSAGPMWSFLSIIGPVEILDPPEGGLTLDQLLVEVAQPGLRIAPSSNFSARVARYNQVSSVSGSSDQWVWVLVVNGSSELTVTLQDCGIGSSRQRSPQRRSASSATRPTS